MISAFKDLPLVPTPASGRLLGGEFVLNGNVRISLPEKLGHLRSQLVAVIEGLAEAEEAGEIMVIIVSGAGEETDEGYSLMIDPGGVILRGSTEAGVFYGLQTLIQLIQAFTSTSSYAGAKGICMLPCLEIKDAPVFAWRGIMLDVARHFLTVSEVKAFIDRLARLKFNVFHWHLTDDQGWRIEIKSRPELTKIGAVRAASPVRGEAANLDGVPYGPFFYTHEDISEVIAYAQARSIMVVPEIDLPGHMKAALAGYPKLGCTRGPYEVRTTWGIEEDVLCLGTPDTLDFARDVLTEVCDLFPGPFIHIGGDEVPHDRWMNCSCCREAARVAGLTSPRLLQKGFTHAVEAFLAGRGKRAIGWDEILDEEPREGTVIASWRGVSGGIKASANGNDAIMCPHTHCYLDYRETDTPGQVLGSPNGQVLSLEKCYAYEPRDASLTPEQASHIIGIQGNVWTEYMWSAEDVNRMVFPRAYAIAEIGWTPAENRDFADFTKRVAKLSQVDHHKRSMVFEPTLQ